ncbi:glycosyltransferase, partial [bacterium]|nr:glycosyltransferase [bacterium]
MKKTLIICVKHPLPEDHGSSIRTMNFVRFFQNYGSVDVAYSNIRSGVKVNNSIFSNEYFVKGENILKIYRWLRIIWQPVPIINYSKVSENILLSIINSNSYDYILVRYVIHTKNLFKLSEKYKSLTIVDFDDIESDRMDNSNIYYSKSLLRKLVLKLNQRFLRAYEKESLNFGASLFCSENDRAKMTDSNSNTYVVPNIYNNQSFEDYNFGDGFENENNLLFVGLLDYKANVNGLKWFIESVFPCFKKIYQNSKLFIVGRSPDQTVKGLCENSTDFHLYANVEDLRKYYKKCKAVIVPPLSGGGTRIKILEAALAKRPVLSTRIGAHGLNFTNDANILLFKNARDFCDKYRKLENHKKYKSLTKNAKNVVKKYYSVQQFNNVMEQVLRKIDQKEI